MNAPAPHLRLGALLCLLVSALAAATMIVFPYLPGGDGPQHVATAYAHVVLDAGVDDGSYGRLLRAQHPWTNLGFLWVYRWWLLVFSWRDAVTASLASMIFLWGVSVTAFVMAVDPRRWPVVLVLVPFGYTWSLYAGFFSFHIATSLGLLVIAVCLLAMRRTAAASTKGLALLLVLWAGGLFVVAMAHLFIAALVMPLAVLIVARAAPAARARVVVVLALGVLPTCALVLTQVGAVQAEGQPGVRWLPLQVLTAVVPAWVAGGPWWRALPLGAAVLHLLAVRPTSTEDRWLRALLIAYAAVTLFVPYEALGWRYIGNRIVPFAIALLGAAVDVSGWSQRRLWGVAAVGSAYALGSLWWLGETQEKNHACIARAVEVELEKANPLGTAIVLDPYCGDAVGADGDFPYIPWAAYAASYLTVERGGALDTFYARRNIHYLRFRDDVVVPRGVSERMMKEARSMQRAGEDDERSALLDRMAGIAAAFEELILVGSETAAAEHARFLDHGYRAVARAGPTLVARFVGCPLSLDVPCPAGARCVVDVGFPGVDAPLLRLEAPQGPLDVEGAPCQGAWLRVTANGVSQCTNVDAAGRHALPLPRAGRYACAAPSPAP